MLSEAKNRLLTRVGPGEPMGEYLRRYWLPIAGESAFDSAEVRPIRLFGEDLVLYKDRSGQLGLIDRQCMHRRADLSYGFVEERGLRCNYHGWLFDADGRCLEQPYEDVANPHNRLKERCVIKAYPLRVLAGLVWAYLGPQPAPELPVYEPFLWPNGFVQVVVSEVPCNWLQCQENSCDPVHFEWMHDNWTLRQRGEEGGYSQPHLKLAFEEFEHGFVYKRIRQGSNDHDVLWTTGRVFLWPVGFFLGEHFEWRIPIDDENTLSVTWFYSRLPRERQPYVQDRIPTWRAPIKDPDGRWITSHVINQDIVAWVGQGRIADRTKENLGASDRGIAMIRNRFLEELEAIQAGNEPKSIIRDREAAALVSLPIAFREQFAKGMSMEEYLKHPLYGPRLSDFRWYAGQPRGVLNAFRAAMGMGPAP